MTTIQQQAQAQVVRLQNQIIPLYFQLLTTTNPSTQSNLKYQITKILQNLNYIQTLINNPHQPI